MRITATASNAGRTAIFLHSVTRRLGGIGAVFFRAGLKRLVGFAPVDFLVGPAGRADAALYPLDEQKHEAALFAARVVADRASPACLGKRAIPVGDFIFRLLHVVLIT